MKRNKRVLIVDDDKDLLNVITDLLELYGYEVYMAEGGREAMDIIKERNISAVVSDIRMPEIDGFHLMTDIKSRFPGIPVVLMTGFSSDDARGLAFSRGAAGFIA
ncbi:MAG: response regulator, partial [Thermodesulfobacteriota bacterium]|nr:response regulator [Thermodesulfobacteriota bacterium]